MSEKMRKIEQTGITRRDFLKSSGLVMTAGGLLLSGCANGEDEVNAAPCPSPEACPEAGTETVEVVKEIPPIPWPYAELDPEVVRKKAHKFYYEAHCCEGAFRGILDELKEKVRFPYTQIPENLMIYGKGGVVGWANLCGAVNGSSAAITLVTGDKDGTPLVNELLGWYASAQLPSEISNEYGSTGQFLVEEQHSDQVLPQSVSGSILCHASVTNWCKASGFASGSPERSERCGRLCGDTAAKAVEILNEHFAGTFSSVHEIPAADTGCRTCHFKGEDFDAGQYTRGKMDCLICHEPHD